MSKKIKGVDIKNRTYYFFDHIINIKSLNPNIIRIDEQSYKKILIYHIEYVTVKGLSYANINSANHFYLIMDKINERIEETNGNKYLT